jgi:predicted nucleic acid-binding protein
MGTLTMPISGRVYLDANCFIYSLEKVQPFAELLKRVWDAVYTGGIRLVSSELTLLEALVGPLQKADLVMAGDVRALLESPEVELIRVDRELLMDAATLRAKFGLKTPDAIHAATSLASGCKMFLTNDKDFQRVHDLQVTVLSEVV